jgi:hypothetical protein
MPHGIRTAADAIAHARDLLSSQDEHLSARLDDVELGPSVAELDAVIGLVSGALAGRTHLRAIEYRKLAAVQSAARARRAELAGPAAPTAEPAASAARPPAEPRRWLEWLRPGPGAHH